MIRSRGFSDPLSFGGQMLGKDNLYCRYVVEHGTDWNVIEVDATHWALLKTVICRVKRREFRKWLASRLGRIGV